jgi:hypothetical protein
MDSWSESPVMSRSRGAAGVIVRPYPPVDAAGGVSQRRLVVTGGGGGAGREVVALGRGATVVGATVEGLADGVRRGVGVAETVVGAAVTDGGVVPAAARGGDPDEPQPPAASASATRKAEIRTRRR